MFFEFNDYSIIMQILHLFNLITFVLTFVFSVHKKIGRGLEIFGTLVAGSPIALHNSVSRVAHAGLAKAVDKPRHCKGNLLFF